MGAIQQALLAYGSAGPAWRTVFDRTDNSNQANYQGYTVRAAATAALVAGSASKARMTIKASTVQALNIQEAYIGIAATSGDAYDFASTPVQLLFAGSATAAVAAGGTIASDEVTIAIGASDGLVVAIYFPASPASGIRGYGSISGVVSNYKSGNSAATLDTSGVSNALVGVTKLEVYG